MAVDWKSGLKKFYVDKITQSETPQEREARESAQARQQAREMTVLALSKAFSLKNGLDPKDPQALEEAASALARLARDREGELSAKLEELAQKEREAAPSEEDSDADIRFLFLKRATLGYGGDQQSEAAQSWFEESSRRYDEQAQALATRIIEAAGAGEALLDPNRREAMARLAGEQKSQEELSVSSAELENRLGHYSVQARRGGDGRFEGFDTVDFKKNNGVLVGDVKGKRFRKGLFELGFAGAPSGSYAACRSSLAQLSPKGAPVELTFKSDATILTIFHTIEDKIKTARDLASQRASACEAGAAVSMAFHVAREAQQGPLAEVGKALEELAKRADEVAHQDKARRTCQWFDSIAGEGASDLAEKVWGGSVPSGMRLGELELLAKSSKELWAALEGQEALGLFSIRMASDLGLELSGRDLAERAKQKMKLAGLSDGGWHLLGKLDASPEGEVAQWTGLAKSETNNSDEAIMRALMTSSVAGEPMSQQEVERSLQEQREKRAERAREESKLSTKRLAMALSLCSARGIDPKGTQTALGLLRSIERFVDHLFGEKVEAPEGTPPEQLERERLAKAARLPKIMGDWLALAAKNPQKARQEFGQARDWARQAEWGEWSQMPQDAGWREVMARQKRWHEMVEARQRSEKAQVSWDGLSSGWSDPQTGFSAHPLTDGGMLWDEGKAMHHCVSSYARYCEQGECRIFSIRKDGERFGTAEVKIDDGSFEVVQFKGRYNAEIDDERAWAAAKAAAAQCKEAMEQKMKEPDPSVSTKLQARREGAVGARAGAAPAM